MERFWKKIKGPLIAGFLLALIADAVLLWQLQLEMMSIPLDPKRVFLLAGIVFVFVLLVVTGIGWLFSKGAEDEWNPFF